MAKCKNVAKNRESLQHLLEQTLNSKQVYFQPPASLKIRYPCIIYELEDMTPRFADDLPYLIHDSYQVTLIDHDPDNCYKEKIARLPGVRFSRYFSADNLHHYVYIMYY